MDRNAFDRLTKVLATSPNRRAALGGLLGASLAGALGGGQAKKHRKRRKTGGTVVAQATCATPGPGANLSGCNFNGQDFSGDDLSGSRLVGTLFRDATLAGTNLSSSNAKGADFRRADMTCANLRSSILGTVDFRAADLTGADLKSSGGCNTAAFNADTTFCATTMCDGSVRNDDCPGGPPAEFCCADTDCPNNQTCNDGLCGCPAGWTSQSGGWCALPCSSDAQCAGSSIPNCACVVSTGTCLSLNPHVGFCSINPCPDGSMCVAITCRRFCGPPPA